MADDIYQVKARIQNAVQMECGINLNKTGEMLVNTYTHVIVTLYNFADTIKDEETRDNLIKLIKEQEVMPANFIKLTLKRQSFD